MTEPLKKLYNPHHYPLADYCCHLKIIATQPEDSCKSGDIVIDIKYDWEYQLGEFLHKRCDLDVWKVKRCNGKEFPGDGVFGFKRMNSEGFPTAQNRA